VTRRGHRWVDRPSGVWNGFKGVQTAICPVHHVFVAKTPTRWVNRCDECEREALQAARELGG
jgi:hypothetical protein